MKKTSILIFFSWLTLSSFSQAALPPIWVWDYNPGYYSWGASELYVTPQQNLLFSLQRTDMDSLNSSHGTVFGMITPSSNLIWDSVFVAPISPYQNRRAFTDAAGNSYLGQKKTFQYDFLKVSPNGTLLATGSLPDDDQIHFSNGLTSDANGDNFPFIYDSLNQQLKFFTEGYNYSTPTPTRVLALRAFDMNNCNSYLLDSINWQDDFNAVRSYIADGNGDMYVLQDYDNYPNIKRKAMILKAINNQITPLITFDSVGFDIYPKAIRKIGNYLMCSYAWNTNMTMIPPPNTKDFIKVWDVSTNPPTLVRQQAFHLDLKLTQIESDGNNYYFGENLYFDPHQTGIPINYLYRMSPNGTLDWTLALPQDELLHTIQVNTSAVLVAVKNEASSDMYLYVINKNTGIVSAKYTLMEFPNGVNTGISQIREFNGDIYVAGNLWQNGRMNARFAKYRATEHVEISDKQTFSIKAYPNPAQDWLTIEGKTTPQHYEIYNYLGAKMNEGDLNSKPIFIGNLPSGNYIVKVIDKNTAQWASVRFVK